MLVVCECVPGVSGLGDALKRSNTLRQIIKAPSGLALLLCALALITSGCVGPGGTPTLAGSIPVAVSLSYSNQTTIAVDLVVNGTKVSTMLPGTDGTVLASSLPAQPWAVQAQTSKGRVLTSMTVRPGDIAQGSGYSRGDAVRVDLSCGRLDIWSGPPLVGPAPGSGSPGDCTP
jgi:hypothetical protein